MCDPLVARLREYVQHKDGCACLSHRRSDDGGWTFAFPPKDCTCGLDDLLAALAASPAPEDQALIAGRRSGKGYEAYQRLIAAVRRGERMIAVGDGYVVLSKAQYDELTKRDRLAPAPDAKE